MKNYFNSEFSLGNYVSPFGLTEVCPDEFLSESERFPLHILVNDCVYFYRFTDLTDDDVKNKLAALLIATINDITTVKRDWEDSVESCVNTLIRDAKKSACGEPPSVLFNEYELRMVVRYSIHDAGISGTLHGLTIMTIC